MSDDASSAAVVLAAGLGTRFGETPKLIAPLAGKPILQHVLDALRARAIAPVVVVVGHARDQVVRAVSWRDEVLVVNRNPERGMLRSVLLGLRRLDEMWAVPERTLIALGDQPRLRGAQIEALLAVKPDQERPFVVPRYQDGRPGNPVLLEASGRTVAQQFVVHTRKDADRGLSQLFARFPEAVRYVDVPGLNPDVDTPDELAALENRLMVGAGYDALGAGYGEWSARIVDPSRRRLVGELMQQLPEGARLLDLGCGPGLPSTALLAERFDVTGVDISHAQLEIARINVPKGKFIEADLASVDFPDGNFNAVTAFYSLIHLPRTELPGLFERIKRWLRPDGLFLATFSVSDSPEWTGDWLGQPMFFSGYDAETNRRLIVDAGFQILTSDEVEIVEPEGPVPFLWVLARNPAD